jgi:serine/threonine protein phosphatase PrpC
MRIAWISTDTGALRPRNEDRCCAGPWVADGSDGAWSVPLAGDRWLAAVADGMGGHQAGEFASETAIAALRIMAERIDSEPSATAVLEHVNQKVFEAMFAPRGGVGMGSTIVGIAFHKGEAVFFNIGDSRAYVVRGREILQASVDHTLDAGSSRRARSHRLTQSLGGTARRIPVAPHVQRARLTVDDSILLCSDGLTDMLGDDEIVDVLLRNPGDPARALVAAAVDAGGSDNVTAVVIGVSVER